MLIYFEDEIIEADDVGRVLTRDRSRGAGVAVVGNLYAVNFDRENPTFESVTEEEAAMIQRANERALG